MHLCFTVIHRSFLAGLFTSLLVLSIAHHAQAQQADSTERSFFLNPKPPSFKISPHQERTVGAFTLPQSGIMEMPEETQYYTPPFKGQYYLDLAVEAYREEQKDKLGLNWLFRFLDFISPYVNNEFEFGVYRINDLPVVERDNPLFQSHKNKDERN